MRDKGEDERENKEKKHLTLALMACGDASAGARNSQKVDGCS